MVDMQKEPAKAGSFFDGRGKMMGSRFKVMGYGGGFAAV